MTLDNAGTRPANLSYSAPEVVDPGIHDGTFESVEVVDTAYGERLRWNFAVDGLRISKFTSLAVNEKSKAGQLIVSMGGTVSRDVNPQAEVDRLIGTQVSLVVEPGKGDYTQIANVMRRQPMSSAIA